MWASPSMAIRHTTNREVQTGTHECTHTCLVRCAQVCVCVAWVTPCNTHEQSQSICSSAGLKWNPVRTFSPVSSSLCNLLNFLASVIKRKSLREKSGYFLLRKKNNKQIAPTLWGMLRREAGLVFRINGQAAEHCSDLLSDSFHVQTHFQPGQPPLTLSPTLSYFESAWCVTHLCVCVMTEIM